MNKLLLGDSLDVLKEIESESVDLLCTDPPYGYSFMGKSWDKTLPDIGIFKECLRVLKPGSFAFVMSAPRSDVCARMMLMLEDAGFEIGFTPIYWTYASGFPKAMNIGKMVDKRLGVAREIIEHRTLNNNRFATSGNGTAQEQYRKSDGNANITAATSPQAKALDGSYGGFQPKPAVEVVIIAMKPLSEKTYVDQALKNGKGITWLDDCRVPIEGAMPKGGYGGMKIGMTRVGETQEYTGALEADARGRFPANLLVSDDVLNDGKTTKSTGGKSLGAMGDSVYGAYGKQLGANAGGLGDSGSYSRYFDLDAWSKTLPFLIVPKAAKSEKNAGLTHLPKQKIRAAMMTKANNESGITSEGFDRFETQPAQNHHPTVKPLKLMSYLITLGSRPGDVVLDPFLGSGTTALAAKQLGRKYIGIEREKEYMDIAQARLDSVQDSLI